MRGKYKIIQGPHRLYTGGNGHKTYGITIQNDRSREECAKTGHSFQWDVNEYSIKVYTWEMFENQTEESWAAIIAEVNHLTQTQEE